jgi:hypothetical protein
MSGIWDLLPETVCVLEKGSYCIQDANARFSAIIAPLSKFKGLNFLENFIAKEEHARFEVALNRVQVAQIIPKDS